MMENQSPVTSPDGSRNRNTPERCPRPLYSLDSTQEHQEIPQACPLYSRDSTQEHHQIPQEHHEIPQARPLYSGDSTQEHQEIPQARPLYSRNTTQEHQKVPQEQEEVSQEDQDEYNILSGTETRDDPEEPDVRSDEPCKEGECSPEISTDPGGSRDTQKKVKDEKEEEEYVRIRQEEAEESYARNDEMCMWCEEPCVGIEIPPEIISVVRKKTKEHSKELRDKVIELHTAGKGYKAISKCLHIPVDTVRSMIRKWKVHQTTETLPRKGRPSKLSEQTRRQLVREATERPSVTLEELQSSVVETGVKVHKTTISRALNKTGLLLSKKHGFMIAVEAIADQRNIPKNSEIK